MTPGVKTEKRIVKRLAKSRKDRIIDGVCAGFADYLGVDSTWIRILWALSVLFGGLGFWLYIAGMVLMPVNAEHLKMKEGEKKPNSPYLAWGLLLILIGVVFLSHERIAFSFCKFPCIFGGWHMGRWLLPLSLVFVGVAMITGLFGTGRTFSPAGSGKAVRRLTRSVRDKKIGGVCGGLGDYAGIDATFIRLAAVVLALANASAALLLYVLLWILLPRES